MSITADEWQDLFDSFDSDLDEYMSEWEESLRAKLESGRQGEQKSHRPVVAKEQHWITIGGHPDPGKDTQHSGGQRILIDDNGKIIGGNVPRALHGTSISEFHSRINQYRETQHGRESSSGSGSGRSAQPPPETSGRMAETPEQSRPQEHGGERTDADKSSYQEAPRRIPASQHEVNRRLDRFEKLFRDRGQHEVADWMGMLKNHVNTVGTDEALKSLGAEGGKGDKGETRYEGEEAGWEDMSSFARDYLARNGITSVYEMGTTSDVRTISSSSPAFGGEGGAGHPEDFQPKDPTLKDKLEESKNLPGLETSEDLGVIMGKPVTHLTPDVLAKMDERYGKGQWIIKTYGDYAYAGNGIFFPQRAAQIPQDAKNTIWASGEHLAKYGFSHWRDKDGQIIGIKHQGGATYRFGSANYDQTINGEVREWADRTAAVAGSEQAAELPFGGQDFMAQPAFPVVGITNEERAQGITFKKGQEARTHIVTRNGKAELIPHTTWLKMESLPVVFEDNETRAMAQAAVDAINALPDSEKQGQIYAPDIVRTADGYKVVEANPANATGSSGYLGDNPFIIDSYVSHLTGREPGHVRFIRNLLSKKKRDVRKGYPHQPRVVGGEGGGRWREAVQHETPHEVLETDAAGGIEPENKQAAREYDLITMPEGIDGTSCANCSHMEESGMCDLLKIHVNERMCCNAWHHRGMLRDYEKRHRPIVQKCADDANRLIDLPDVRQLNKWSCGAASSMAIGRYFGVGPSTIGEWMKELGTTVEHSTHPFAIRDYFLSLGCQVEARDGMTIDDLADYTHRGMPVIVCLQDYGPEVPKKAEFDYGHYLSVIGVGMGLVFAQDSAEENAAHVPGGDVPKSEADDEGNIAAPGRVMIEQGKFLDTWHDKDVAGNPFIRYGIAIGPPS